MTSKEFIKYFVCVLTGKLRLFKYTYMDYVLTIHSFFWAFA